MNNISNLCTVVLPTFFPGNEIFENLKSIPNNLKILIIDNSYTQTLKEKITKYKNCEYFNIGDVGLGKTFNFALSKINTPYILLKFMYICSRPTQQSSAYKKSLFS